MKKTLIALAALASIGSAFAQDAKPTITPYVRLDIGMQNETKTGVPDSGLVGADSVYKSSIWGIKGDTDLGSGMKGFAQVEQRFNANGANGLADPGNARVGKIGISGGFGTIALGAQWGPYDNTTGYGDAQDYNGFSAYGRVLNKGAHWDNGNGGSWGQTVASLQYTSPSYGGLVYEVNYAPSKDATKTTDNSSWGADVVYSAGPLTVAGAIDSTPTSASRIGGSDTGKSKAWKLEGAYDLGMASIHATFIGADTNGTALGSDKDTGYAFSVKVPAGKWTMSAGLGNVKTTGDDWNQKTDALGIQALYAFNKSFEGYIGYRTFTTTFDSGAPDYKESKTGFGLNFSY